MEKLKNNKKLMIIIAIAVVVVIAIIIGIVALGGNGSSSSKQDLNNGKMFLTEERIKDIKETALDKTNNKKLSFSYQSSLLSGANARISAGSYDVKGVKKYESCEVTSTSKEDDGYNYKIYGNIYGVDEFNRTIKQQFSMTVYCKQAEDTEKGYKVENGGFSLSNLN